jgi:hypothetical protein
MTAMTAMSLVLLVSCDDQRIEVYRIPKENMQVGMQAGEGSLVPPPPSTPVTWQKPAGWSEQLLSEMRQGSFKAVGSDGKSADISIISFPGEAGGIAANINRWRGQLNLPLLSPEELEKSTQRMEVEGVPTYLVDLHSPENAENPSRILGAVFQTPDRAWFVKMTGEPALLESEKENFLGFVRSFKFAKPASEPAAAAESQPRSTNEQ